MTEGPLVPKPPLSDPMAEAMAEDAAEAARVAALAPPSPATPPAGETPSSVAPPNADEGEPTPLAAPNEDPTKPAKGNEKAFLARIARLADDKRTRDTTIAEQTRQLAAMRELLASQGHAPPLDPAAPPASVSPPQQTGSLTQADVDARAREIADWQDYNRQANDLAGVGKEKFGTWDDSLANLNAAGILSEPAMQRQIVEAALATGAAPDVIHHLGQNLDEAIRISMLPPARMGVELATLAGKLTKKAPAISQAPAPIGNGRIRNDAGEAAPDLAKLAEGPMGAYVEARKKAGDPWANGRRGAFAPRDT